jgi:hypothetical protein
MAEDRTAKPLGRHIETLADTDSKDEWTQPVYPIDFWPLEQWQDGPVIAAAGLEDSIKLRCFIERSHHLESRGENVTLLLDEGANPNGVPMSKQIDMARRFRRFCYEDPATNESESMRWNMEDMDISLGDDEISSVPSQIHPPHLIDDELDDRRRHCGPFWAVPHCFEIDYSMDEALYHSVVMAGLATPGILDQILDAGADISAWREPLAETLPEEENLKP